MTTTAPTEQRSMTHRQVLEALSGILLGMFVSILATSVVSSSLPRIIADLGGTQSAFTWVVTATLLTTTISTPVWGKLADLAAATTQFRRVADAVVRHHAGPSSRTPATAAHQPQEREIA